MTVPIDRADFVDLLERAAWAVRRRGLGMVPQGAVAAGAAADPRGILPLAGAWRAGRAPGPAGQAEWRVWFLRAGRGFGKTMAGAHWVLDRARENPGARIALVGGERGRGSQGDDRGAGRADRPGAVRASRCCGTRRRGSSRFHSGARGFVYSAAGAGEIARAGASFRLVRRAREMEARAMPPGTICRWGCGSGRGRG